jgi:hypothetical protein
VLFDFKGDSNNDQFGYSLASAGDVNGDGSLDIIVGAIGDDPHGQNSGSARVLSGRDGQILYTFDGPASAAAFGWSVSGAGDVNADGFADVIASSFSQSKPDYAEVYSGADGVLLHHFDEFYGGANTVAGIGDVDEDGFADVMVGPSVADSADVYSGRDGSLLFRPGGEDREGFGWAVTGVGDVTGDGVPEFAVGAPNGNWDQTGYVRLYSGRACTARSSNYGLGWPGTFGIPALSSSAEPRFCAATTIDVSNSRTSTTSAVLFLGLDRASLFTEWDGILLVSPSWVISFVLPDPGISLPAFIPCDGSLCGTVVYAQVLEQDPGASKGVSFTPGLQIVLGY